jgi:hypothetical protein
MKGIPRLEFLEVVSVGFPFCLFKLAGAVVLAGLGGPWAGVALVLFALTAVDLLFNGANLAGLVLIRRRVLDACFLSFAARLFQRLTGKSRRTLEDFGNSLDVLISFSIVAFMVGAGGLRLLPPDLMPLWNLAVVFNVLGAGLGRLTESVQKLSLD